MTKSRMPMMLAVSTVVLAVTLVGNAATSPVAGPLPVNGGAPGQPPPGGPGGPGGGPGGGGPGGGGPGGGGGGPAQPPPNGQTFPDPTGETTTISTTGPAPGSNPFFTPLGTNGRACITCHAAATGWTVTPALVQARFEASNGLDPIFRTVDGSNSPLADVSTVDARRNAYSMLLNRGVIRIGLPIPNGADFTLTAVDDPYHFASASQLSLFRRPLPTTDLRFLSTVMWDGREIAANGTIAGDLGHQAIDAVLTHEQGTASPSATQVNQIVAFESGLYSAQSKDNGAGLLNAAGATGGPVALSTQTYVAGINNPALSTFNPHVFTLYNAWAGNATKPTPTVAQQESIARGEAIFNTRPFSIENVGGLNDVLKRPIITGTCSACHNAPNAGSSSVGLFVDEGVVTAVRRTPDLPLYTLKDKANGQVRQVTDPGRALVTGKFADIGKVKVPTLRDLAARAPYFQDGSAPTTQAVVDFYNRRFNMGLSPQEQADLKAFLDFL